MKPDKAYRDTLRRDEWFAAEIWRFDRTSDEKANDVALRF